MTWMSTLKCCFAGNTVTLNFLWKLNNQRWQFSDSTAKTRELPSSLKKIQFHASIYWYMDDRWENQGYSEKITVWY